MRKLFLLPALCLAFASVVAIAADVDQLLATMTLDEKLAMLHGVKDPEPALGLDSAGYLPGVPRLGIPPLRLTDGPAGIRTTATATALPAPVMLAASFDRTLARQYGEVLGKEGLDRNQQVLLSPMVNMVRVPQAGRNFETLGEDPFLAGAMVAAEITGIQSQGMMATVKHFAANNQEQDRLTINASVDERTLREIYLPAFESAIKAGVASVMCAYNQVNNQFSCENSYQLQQVLRKEWGFEGFVMTDWWARHSLAALDNGLNLEMPGWVHPEYPVSVHFDEPLRAAVQNGSIPTAKVDAALRPLLLMMNRFGMLDGKQGATFSRDLNHHAAALQTAVAGAVLLKNDKDTLPLSPDSMASTLLLGPTARWTLAGGGGSSRVLPSAHDNTVDLLGQLGTGTRPQWLSGYDIEGTVIPAKALRVPGKKNPGLRHTNNAGKSSNVATLNHTGNAALRGSGMRYWRAELVAPQTGSYKLFLQTDGPTASLYHGKQRMLFNDNGVLSNASLLPTRDGLRNAAFTVQLKAGEHYPLRVEVWTGDNKPVQLRLTWLTPAQRAANIAAAVSAAGKTGNVVVFAHVEGSEGSDHSTLALPDYQDELISALTQTSARITVVLNTGAPVTMPWADKVSAILQMWYPGQAGGEATARLLLGLDNPSGKLPVSFPRSEADTPVNEPLRYPGVDNQQQYSEGLLIGYRWYYAKNIQPLFPFGHGLSYTQFDYSDLAISGNGDTVSVSFTVKNSGSRTGAEVPQLYLEQSGTGGITTEVRKLVGFDKVLLNPGESRTLTMAVPARSFAYWNVTTHQWQPLPGRKALAVGASSKDLRQSASFVYSPQQQ